MKQQHCVLRRAIRRLGVNVLLLASACLLVSGNAAVADELVVSTPGELTYAPLPLRGAQGTEVPVESLALELVYLDDGRLLALRQDEELVGDVIFYEIEADGGERLIGQIARPAEWAQEAPVDLSVDRDGRLFYLSAGRPADTGAFTYRVAHIDPSTAETLQSVVTEKPVRLLARAPEGFWTFTNDGLERLDPDTGSLSLELADVQPQGSDGETDSSGVLWLFGEGVCSPPCPYFVRLDPAVGTSEFVPSPLEFASKVPRDVTVRRTCDGDDTSLCLQGGRFLVQVTWRDFEDRQGFGNLTPARSSDSGVFWFFHPANWELMVKVLDGCDLNGKYWVFTSGSTTVEYEISVFDQLGNEVRRYENPLGRVAETVTDTAAFDCAVP